MAIFTKDYPTGKIATFFLLATGLSLIFRIYHPVWLNNLKLPYGYGLNLLVGFGPMLAAMALRKASKDLVVTPSLSLFGTSVIRSIIFLSAPILVLIVCGIKNTHDNSHLLGVKTSLFWLVYIYGEEYGWRGYLQQLTKGNIYIRALVIGIIWYLWHLSFVFDTYNFQKELFFLLVLIVGSFFALLITRITHSLLTAIGLHFSFSVMTNVPFTQNYKYGVLVMVGVWLLLIFSWKRKPLL
jgi:hypothetical protein